jgi:hypothetical protein
MKKNEKLIELCREALDIRLTSHAELKIQTAIDQELNKQTDSESSSPVMIVKELIAYLRITPEILEDYLEEIPCFELGGNLLFRREAIDKWIKSRENKYSMEVTTSNVKNNFKFFVA